MPFNISKVEVQGAKDAKEWPYKFCLSYSLDGSLFTELTTQESSCLVSDRAASFYFFLHKDRTSSHYRCRGDANSRCHFERGRGEMLVTKDSV